jgi:hypothetical protein
VEALLPDWRGAPPEPEVVWEEKLYLVGAMCNFVNNPNFAAPAPPPVVSLLAPPARKTLTGFDGGERSPAAALNRRSAG